MECFEDIWIDQVSHGKENGQSTLKTEQMSYDELDDDMISTIVNNEEEDMI